MGDIRVAANIAFRDFTEPGSAEPNEPVKAEIRNAFAVVEDTIAATAIGPRAYESWSAMATDNTQPARTYGVVSSADTGSHTDPVVGGTVLNAGYYSYSTSPAGWQRIGSYIPQEGRTVRLFRTGASTASAIVADPDVSVPVTTLKMTDLFILDILSDAPAGGVTINIAGIGAKELRTNTGDVVPQNYWRTNNFLMIMYHQPSDRLRIIDVGKSSADPVPTRITDYLPVTQTNTSGNLWSIRSATGRAPSTSAELTTMSFVVAYESSEEGIQIDASQIYVVDNRQLVWPSGAQVNRGQLRVGQRVEFGFMVTGVNAGKWAISVPNEPGGSSTTNYYAAGAAALYAQRQIGR